MSWKKIGKWILFPPPVFIWLLCPVATVLLVYGFVAPEASEIFRIVSYVVSFYALMVASIRVPDLIRFVARFKRENKYIVNISLYGTFAFNAVYAVFQLYLGLWHRSVWFYAMAGYYLLLALMRLLLVRYTGSHAPGEHQQIEWRKYRLCGLFLLLMNLALGIIITYFVLKIRTFRHHEITTIAMATYTFASLALAIRNVIRYTRYGSPAYSAAKAISLVSAIVSMLTLENAMLTVFGDEGGELLHQIMLGATGIAVLLVVQGIALYMILNAGRKLRRNS